MSEPVPLAPEEVMRMPMPKVMRDTARVTYGPYLYVRSGHPSLSMALRCEDLASAVAVFVRYSCPPGPGLAAMVLDHDGIVVIGCSWSGFGHVWRGQQVGLDHLKREAASVLDPLHFLEFEHGLEEQIR